MKASKIRILNLSLLSIVFLNILTAQESNVVIDGNARFTVLTPTLIRTEYTGDGVFEDGRSYNIVEHNLPVPSYTTTVNNGWREIQTEKIILRYKQNSGVFDTDNLTISLNNGQIVAKPWKNLLYSYREEAENAKLVGGAKVASDHKDYDGSGFVAGLKTVGAGIEWAVKNNFVAGEYKLLLKYSNGMGSDRTISLYVDDMKTQILLPKTTDWEEWKIFEQKIILTKGPHTFKLMCDTDDSYNVNIDWINIKSALRMNQICEAEEATLAGGASIATEHGGFSGSGFVAGLTKTGPSITWDFDNNLPAGDYVFSIKYANGLPGTGEHIDRTMSLYVNEVKTQVLFPKTADWKTWDVFQRTISLDEGPHTIRLSCDAGESHRVNVDWLAVTPVGKELPDENLKTNLGAWSRGLDEKKGAIPLWDGILSHSGWYLLDDSETALHDNEGWVADRPAHTGGYQDGYFFGYGTDFQTALKDFYKITGNPVLLPKWAFGVWYSINSETYTNSSYYQNTLLPAFRSAKIPLDVLVVDTDWKLPERWNGWNWHTTNFSDPQDFMNWTKEQGLVIPLNLHPTIQNNDPKFSETNTTAGGLIANGNRYHFDFTNKKHARAYFDLHKPFHDLGVRFWWFDQAETPNSQVEGVPADTWINGLYADNMIDRGQRGFAFSRIGSGHAGYNDNRKPGIAWSEHRYTLHFTGDTYATWDMLAFQSTFTIKEGNIGIPYISHDLGSYHGDQLSDDMYMRWVQFGTFQPIFRLHSKRGKRLPWQYANVQQHAEEFIRLRHALVPYTYTLAHESASGGLPIVRGMYFYYPEAQESYSFDRQYFYGEKILVSPIVSAGAKASTQVWFPEGTWINFFNNEIITGPAVQNVLADYSSMPVFVKTGGIIPLAPYSDYIGQHKEDLLTLKVYAGADGEFTLYEDEGVNLNYQSGKSALTLFEYKQQERKFSIKARQGNYTGAPEERSYNIEFYNAAVPEKISVNGIELNKIAVGSGEGWWINNDVVYVSLNRHELTTDIDITFVGLSSDLSDESVSQNIKLFPNPATDLIMIRLDNIDKESFVTVFNASGEKMIDKIITGKEIVIDTQVFSKGIYFVEINNGNNRFVEKLIIK